MTRKIDGKQMTATSSGWEYQCTLTLDAKTSPKQIDIAVLKSGRAPQKLKGIFRIDGDKLQIAEDAQQRPTSFSTDENTRAIVYTFRKLKR